ncbi:MAG TPA: hypothetical protein ENJ11_08505 [Gammaproteobacteria bacterium]|nr:hypothetical protein [Gammaproteobacteria bacterium]
MNSVLTPPDLPASSTPRRGYLLALLLVSSLVIAQSNGLLKLPEVYRTPLSDMAVQNNPEWRGEDAEDNPWRAEEEELIIKPRIKAEFFPKYNYDSVQDPNPGSLFQNEYELDKPVSNIFKYTF